MGAVYRGRDRVLDRTVAVKLLPAEMASDDRAADRLQREARSAARLNHPRIVSVFDAGVTDGTPFLVMEHVEGRTLAEELRAEGRLPPERAATIAAGIAEALAAAHAAGAVHRDVKPSNVMLTNGDDVKVMDFGIARAGEEDTITHPSVVVGSAPYLSPEQARGEAADPRSDVYGLGVVLYEMLAGRPPFEAESPVAVAFKHLEERPAPPSSHEPGIPPDLDRVVLRALAKDPADRFGSAEAFLAALQPFTAGHDTLPMVTTSLEAAADGRKAADASGPWSTRIRPRWAVLAAIALAMVAAAVAAMTLLGATGSPGRSPGEEDPRPSVSVSSLPGMAPTMPSPEADQGITEGEDGEGGGGGQGGSSGSTDVAPPTTEPTEPPSPTPGGSATPPEATSPPPPSPTASLTATP